jgi:hypothetical protein
VSTHATAALSHACQGEVVHGPQMHGKQQASDEHGKIGSAGFAQILGEQVFRSAVPAHDPRQNRQPSHATEQDLRGKPRLPHTPKQSRQATVESTNDTPPKTSEQGSVQRFPQSRFESIEHAPSTVSLVQQNRPVAHGNDAVKDRSPLVHTREPVVKTKVEQAAHPAWPLREPAAETPSKQRTEDQRSDSQQTAAKQEHKPENAHQPGVPSPTSFTATTSNKREATTIPSANIIHTSAQGAPSIARPARFEPSALPASTAAHAPLPIQKTSLPSLERTSVAHVEMPVQQATARISVPQVSLTPPTVGTKAAHDSARPLPAQAAASIPHPAPKAGAMPSSPAAHDSARPLPAQAAASIPHPAPKTGYTHSPTSTNKKSAGVDTAIRDHALSDTAFKPTSQRSAADVTASRTHSAFFPQTTIASRHFEASPATTQIPHLSVGENTVPLTQQSSLRTRIGDGEIRAVAKPTVTLENSHADSGAQVHQSPSPQAHVPNTTNGSPRIAAPNIHASASDGPRPPTPTPEPHDFVLKFAHDDPPVTTNTSPVHEAKPAQKPANSPTLPVAEVGVAPVLQPTPATVAQHPLSSHVFANPPTPDVPETTSPRTTAATTAKTTLAGGEKPSPVTNNGSAKAAPTRAKADPGNVRPETDAKNPHINDEAKPPRTDKAEASTDATVRTTPDKAPTSTTKGSAPATASTANQGANKISTQAEPTPSKRRARLAEEEKPGPAAKSATPSAQPNQPTAVSAPVLNAESKPIKPEPQRSGESASVVDHPLDTSHAQPTASTPHAVTPSLSAHSLSTVAPTDRPTTFASQTTFQHANLETTAREVSAPSRIAEEHAGLIDRAINDPGLSMNVMPHSAHVSIAGDAGDLALHVRVRDGSADINVSGTMAPLFNAKAPEVRSVLAGEGLQLGSFATDQQGHSRGQQGQPESAPRTSDPHPLPPPGRASTSTPEIQSADDRRIHVTA